MLHLYNTLNSHIAASNDELIKENVFGQIYPNQKYNDQKWRLLNSQLLKRIEKHVVSQRLVENKEMATLELLKFYRELSLKSHFESHFKTTQKFFQSAEVLDTNYNDALIELENEKSEHLLSKRRNQELNIQQTLNQVDIAFIIKKLKYACSALAHESVFAIEYDYGLLHSCINQIDNINLKKHPALDLYFSCYNMLKEPDNLQKFNAFRNNILTHQSAFKKEEIRAIYLLGINMCIRRLNSGDQKFGKIGLEMYEEALKRKHLLINNKLSRYSYRNIAMMAIRSDDFDWANKFTEEYKDSLRKAEIKSAYHLNKALIHYHQKELESARDYIVEADFKDHLIHLAAKSLQAKIYYELKESSLLNSHLDSMEMYIIRKKIIGFHKQNYKTFISYLRKMIRLAQYDKDKRTKLQTQIKAEKVLTERKWFLEQIG